ncbi:MAG TPA: hypothetical protein VEL76_17150 [Gemmataceae bacterium]|nr:hypothetical protein [Gemmataceae bacterium]
MSHQPLLIALALPTLAWATAVAQVPSAAARTQVRFAGPAGMQVRWLVRGPDGQVGYSEPPLEAPARYNFRQGATYPLKLSGIPGFPGLELYPTLEVPLVGPAAQQFLAHSAVQLALTDEDFRRATAGELVVKTVHLPGAGGVVAPLLVLRLGNRDLEVPGTPGKD